MDTYFNIYVTHVDEAVNCPDRPKLLNLFFWGQKEREISVKLQDHLNAIQFDSFPVPTIYDLKKQNSIFCVIVNSTWLRATTSCEQLIDKNRVEVCFIDYGLKKNVPLDFIRLIPIEAVFVRECPPLATRFLLGDVVVKNDQYEKERVYQFLKENLMNKLVKAVSLGYHGGFEGLRVYLKDVLLAKLLVEGGWGIPSGTYSEALQKPAPTHYYISIASFSTPVKVASVAGLRSTCTASPTNRQLVNPSQHQARPNGSRTYMASVLESNTLHRVIVTHVENGPQKFSIQLKSAEADQKLVRISQQVAAFADRSLTIVSNPGRGVPCIAVFPRDKMFHRGLITQNDDSKFANVYFVDFGFSEPINQESLFEIPDNLIAIDLHAIRVSLAEADTLMGIEKVSEIFTRIVLNKVFNCRVIGNSAPLSVVLTDESGRSVKDLVLSKRPSADSNVSGLLSLDTPITDRLSAISQIGYRIRTNFKVDPVEVKPEEQLFVTFVGPPGHFFGQFEKRPEEELKALESELSTVYSKCSNVATASNIPLLYADVQGHLGDYAVVRWSDDGNLYRVRIAEEHVNHVLVDFIDYGNSIRVPRHEIWAPVMGLKQFCQPPFGIQCLVSGIKVTADQWEKSLAEKSMKVKLEPGINGVYQATLESNIFDSGLSNDKNLPYCLSPEAPPFVPTYKVPTVNSIEPVRTNVQASRRLFDSTIKSLVATLPTVEVAGSVHTTLSTQPGAPTRCSNTTADSKFAVPRSVEDDWSKKNNGDGLSVNSNSKKSGYEQTERNFGQLEDVSSSKQKMLKVENEQLFYPPQPRLEGATKQLEVVFAENPSSFYCQLAEAAPQLDELMTMLETLYSDASKPCVIGAKKGVACVAQYTVDGAWYRGEVLNVEGADVDILFVDYGNKQRTPLNLVKAIEMQFVTLPHQAYHCCLSGIADNRSWTTEEKEQFEQVAMSKSLTATFAGQCENAKYPVELVENIPGSPLVINKLFGASIPLMIPPPETGYSNLPIPSAPVEVNVAWFYNCERFFLSPVDVVSSQEKLGDLEKFYSSLPSNELVEDGPKVGLPCVVQFQGDGHYYRAQILAIHDQVAKVLFVDYGNEQDTPIKELKRIHPSFMKCPQLTWQCKLKGVKLAKNLPVDTKQHMDTCFLSGEIMEALFHPSSEVAFDVELKLPKIGSAVEYLLKQKVVESSVQSEKDVVLAPQSREVEVYVAYAVSPSCFWIQRKQDEDLIYEIQDKLSQMNGNNAESFKLHSRPAVGDIYAVMHPEYSTWYRAQLKSIANNSAEIQFIDYGDTHSVPINNFCTLPDDLKSIPPMAIHCSLNMTSLLQKWSEDALKYFVGACSPDVVCRVVLGCKEANNIQLVDSFLTSTENVVEVLMSKIQLSHSKNIDDVVDLMESTSISEKKEQPTIPSSRDWIRDSVPGQIISTNGSAVCIPSALAVWIQLNPSLADAIVDLIQEYVDSPEFAKSIPLQPFVGCFCLALFSEDHRWYRAVVEAVYPDSITVKYVDYGNSTSVGLDHLRNLPTSLIKQPALALKCALDGADTNPSTLPDFEDCQNVIFNQILSVTLVKKTPDWIVVRLRDEQGNDLNEKLGLAVSVGQDIPNIAVKPKIRTIPNSEEVMVSHVKSAGMFWIQRKSDEEAIEQIRDNLRQLDGSSSDERVSVKVGELYAVMHPEYNRYYRARVERIEDEEIEVFFFDYGQTAWASMASVRPCPAFLKYIPPMATECTFRTPIHPDQFSEEIQKTFMEVTEGVVCQAVFYGPQPAKGVHSVEALYANEIEVVAHLTKTFVKLAAQSGISGGSVNN